MKSRIIPVGNVIAIAAVSFLACSYHAAAADKNLLDVLLANGQITEEQHRTLVEQQSQTTDAASDHDPASDAVTKEQLEESVDAAVDARINDGLAAEIAAELQGDSPVKASRGSSGFRLETQDGKWQTNLQWRAQLRYSSSLTGDPRQLPSFDAASESTFEPRRLRMKIGGHGYQPWLKYYFEVDLQPNRDPDSSSSSASARVIDWRIDIAKWNWGALRVGQWKVDLNRERGDSSGRQQFVERSIVNRVFTIDRQIGIQLRGHLFRNTPADLRYYAGVFNGEGRAVRDNDTSKMYMGRVQWNFMGRDLPWRQTDVEYTELPTGSLAFGAATNEGSCTRWSSSGCGNLDGYTAPAVADSNQFKVDQLVQEFAFKWRGFSLQQEYHRKTVKDRVATTESDLNGGYIQSGYFFHNLFQSVPVPLELAIRYAFVDEPNAVDTSIENSREELTFGANWFFSGHNNKLTMDYSHLSLDDNFVGRSESENRLRFQWDISF